MPETTVASVDGTTLAARCSGRGSPLVLVHGGNGDLDTFRLVEGALAERHSVWAYSRRGRGGSGDGPDYSFEGEVEDVLAVLEAAGGDAHLFGHSGGAMYALFAAGRAPSLRSLVLYEPPLRSDRFDPTLVDRVETAIDAGDPGRALELFFAAVAVADRDVQALRSFPPVWARLCEGVRLVPREIRAGLTMGTDWLSSLDPPDVPTLYLYGEETDAPIFAGLDEVADLLPKAQLHGLPGQRHLAFAFDPASFAQAILEFTTAHD
jgi:pimeloyl-ACP methyl ester carboxylesterase